MCKILLSLEFQLIDELLNNDKTDFIFFEMLCFDISLNVFECI